MTPSAHDHQPILVPRDLTDDAQATAATGLWDASAPTA